MPGLNDFKTDCRQFRWDRPCAPHKTEGVTCASCPSYDPVRTRLLIAKLAAVGDVLRTTSFLPAIRKKYPGAWITWVTSPDAASLFDGNDLVDEVWTPDDPRLRVQAFDVALSPDADPQTAAIAGAANAGEIVGFALSAQGAVTPTNAAAEEWLLMGIDDDRKKANTETYQNRVANALGLDPADVVEPILEPSEQHIEHARTIRPSVGQVVGINTGAGPRWERKRWTAEHQRTLIEKLTESGVGGPVARRSRGGWPAR